MIMEVNGVYAQLEAAGLIQGTDEWKDKQERENLQMLKEVMTDAGQSRHREETV